MFDPLQETHSNIFMIAEQIKIACRTNKPWRFTCIVDFCWTGCRDVCLMSWQYNSFWSSEWHTHRSNIDCAKVTWNSILADSICVYINCTINWNKKIQTLKFMVSSIYKSKLQRHFIIVTMTVTFDPKSINFFLPYKGSYSESSINLYSRDFVVVVIWKWT